MAHLFDQKKLCSKYESMSQARINIIYANFNNRNQHFRFSNQFGIPLSLS